VPLQHVGRAAQIAVTHALHADESAAPVAHWLCAQLPALGLTQCVFIWQSADTVQGCVSPVRVG
jgi:hypothetical protein